MHLRSDTRGMADGPLAQTVADAISGALVKKRREGLGALSFHQRPDRTDVSAQDVFVILEEGG